MYRNTSRYADTPLSSIDRMKLFINKLEDLKLIEHLVFNSANGKKVIEQLKKDMTILSQEIVNKLRDKTHELQT